jgi:hypothetical protein
MEVAKNQELSCDKVELVGNGECDESRRGTNLTFANYRCEKLVLGLGFLFYDQFGVFCEWYLP